MSVSWKEKVHSTDKEAFSNLWSTEGKRLWNSISFFLLRIEPIDLDEEKTGSIVKTNKVDFLY